MADNKGEVESETLSDLTGLLESGDLEMNTHFGFIFKGTFRDYLKLKLAIRKAISESSGQLVHYRVSASKLYLTKDGGKVNE